MIDYTEKIPNNVDLGATGFCSAHWSTGSPRTWAGGTTWAQPKATITRCICAPPSPWSPMAGPNSVMYACRSIGGEFFCSRAMPTAK